MPSEQCEQPSDHERAASREPSPGNGASDRADAVTDRQPDEREETEEADRDQRANKQALQDPAGGPRQSPLVRAQVKGEEGGQQREAAGVDDGEAAGDERDRERNRADPRSS